LNNNNNNKNNNNNRKFRGKKGKKIENRKEKRKRKGTGEKKIVYLIYFLGGVAPKGVLTNRISCTPWLEK
jgi:hypothetical protein